MIKLDTHGKNQLITHKNWLKLAQSHWHIRYIHYTSHSIAESTLSLIEGWQNTSVSKKDKWKLMVIIKTCGIMAFNAFIREANLRTVLPFLLPNSHLNWSWAFGLLTHINTRLHIFLTWQQHYSLYFCKSKNSAYMKQARHASTVSKTVFVRFNWI